MLWRAFIRPFTFNVMPTTYIVHISSHIPTLVAVLAAVAVTTGNSGEQQHTVVSSSSEQQSVATATVV